MNENNENKNNDIEKNENIENETIETNNDNNNSDNAVSIVEDKLPSRLIIIPVMGKPLFPGLYAPFPIPASQANAVNRAIAENDGFLGLNLYIQDEAKDIKKPTIDEIYKVGVVVKVFKKLNMKYIK